MFGRKKEQEPVQREYPLREMIQTLVELSEEQWGGYAFYHEPLERKFTEEQKKEYARLASACGREEAVLLREKFPGESIRSMAEKSGLKVKLPDMPTGGGHVIFAQFTEPDEIVIYRDCIKRAEVLIKEEGLNEYLGAFRLQDLLLAHELFHGVEYQKRETIFTQTERIELWKKPFSNRSRILCLSEMAAMAFAKELLCIAWSPYVMDVLLMYGYEKTAACALYEEILEAAGVRERED